jgi:aminoglycoside 6'-N-acetyltransferase I
MIRVRAARREDAAHWLRMRQALWPGEANEHADEIEQYFAGTLRMPLEVLLAVADDAVIGLAELRLSALTRRVAMLPAAC